MPDHPAAAVAATALENEISYGGPGTHPARTGDGMHRVAQLDRLVGSNVPAAQACRPAAKQISRVATRFSPAAEQWALHPIDKSAQLDDDRVRVHNTRPD